jgi:exonuclease SbcD
VQHFAGEEEGIKTYNDALRYAIRKMGVDRSRKNILITHQYITDAERTESEDIMVGGLDNVDASIFDDFDYVALGHLHRAQSCGRNTVRYSGSPLKYSFSEVNDKKSVSIIKINGNQEVKVTSKQLNPLHDWYDLRGTYDELTARAYYDGTDLTEAFVRITLTDEEDIPDGMRKLKTIYHRLTELRYDNNRTRAGLTLVGKPMNIESLNPTQLFGELFEKQNAQKLSKEQSEFLQGLIDKIFNNK